MECLRLKIFCSFPKIGSDIYVMNSASCHPEFTLHNHGICSPIRRSGCVLLPHQLTGLLGAARIWRNGLRVNRPQFHYSPTASGSRQSIQVPVVSGIWASPWKNLCQSPGSRILHITPPPNIHLASSLEWPCICTSQPNLIPQVPNCRCSTYAHQNYIVD